MGTKNLTPACGRHCKTKIRTRMGGLIQTQRLKHCKRKCCHGKPVKK